MKEKESSLVCPHGHYVWVGKREKNLEGEIYDCFCCADITNPEGGRYKLSQLVTAAIYSKNAPVRDGAVIIKNYE